MSDYALHLLLGFALLIAFYKLIDLAFSRITELASKYTFSKAQLFCVKILTALFFCGSYAVILDKLLK